ncbi:MAG: glycosyltransferase [Lachnospiraceae bacterium]|nr:glycosyltransferase [Lachnospiraceae bacterium]
MNICLLNDSFPPVIDGVANVVLNYGRALTQNHGANVIVGTPKYPNADYTGYPYKVVPYPSIDTTGIIDGYRAGNSLSAREIDEIAEFGPDIIHTHCPASSTFMARILQHSTGAPVVFTYHTKFDIDIARAVGGGFRKKEVIKVMINNISACDEVWTVSQGAGENLKSLGFEGDYRVMPNGVDFARGRADDAAVKAAVKEYDLPPGVPIFLFVGRLVKYKGLPLILEALKMAREEGLEFRMLMVGSGPDAEELRKMAADLRLTDKVFFTGPIRDREVLRAINTRADLFLFPSTYDTNGIVVREAAACGLASVLIKGSCAAEGITHGRNGYLIDETPEAMAKLLTDICKDMDKVAEVGDHAMKEIYLSWDDAVKMAYERYGEIRELAAAGEYLNRKREPVDYLIAAAADAAEAFKRIGDVPKHFITHIHEEIEAARDRMEGQLWQ